MNTGNATHITTTSSIARKAQIDNLHLKRRITLSGYYDMPVLAPCHVIPTSLIPFNVALTTRRYSCGVHFFIDDYQFERVWNLPERYIDRLNRFECVIAPDFSQYTDMPFPQRIWNNYRGKFIGAWLQNFGLNIIPNVTWSLPDSYDFCFDGIPKHSVIAINSTGASRSGVTKYLWLKGYREALLRIEPACVLRYGNRIEGEDSTISIYFQNERIVKLREDGRKRNSI